MGRGEAPQSLLGREFPVFFVDVSKLLTLQDIVATFSATLRCVWSKGRMMDMPVSF